MRLQLFRSSWGLGQLTASHSSRVLHAVRDAGFEGIEASLQDIGRSTDERAALCGAVRDEGLKLILSAYSSWPNYEGPFEHLTRTEHAERLNRDFAEVAELCARSGPLQPVVMINAHSGSDTWDDSESRDFIRVAMERSSAYGADLPRVAHETHRGRVLCCPFRTARLLRELPQLRLTSDLSHWVVKSERLLDASADAAVLSQIAGAVDHLHARIGTPQNPQVADVAAPMVRVAAERFYAFWEEVWSAREASSISSRDSTLTANLEYGPVESDDSTGEYCGYTPVGLGGWPIAGEDLDATIGKAATALRGRFESWHARGGMRRSQL
mmetsp:Transcript_41834/g.89262  ORF Transcript_41834/g.89262 Transcript_41834/m.89262 type:complete len:326 (-) Transcript_41834:302-1279(-)